MLRTGTMPLTITHLARLCGLSRSTLLYYESAGLLRPARRGSGAYRVYGEKDVVRLRQVRAYREAEIDRDRQLDGLGTDEISGALATALPTHGCPVVNFLGESRRHGDGRQATIRTEAPCQRRAYV